MSSPPHDVSIADWSQALQDYALRSPAAHARLDRLARLASSLLNAPAAFVAVKSEHGPIVASHVGFTAEDLRKGSGRIEVLTAASEPSIVGEAGMQRKNRLRLGGDDARFYALVPLASRDGDAVGILCVVDVVGHPTVGERELALLQDLAAAGMEELELSFERDEANARADRNQATVAELQHRMGNILSNVSALVSLSARERTDVASLAEDTRQRLIALSAAHKALARSEFQHANLREVVETVLQTSGDGLRVDLDGPEVALRPSAAFALAMIVSELAAAALASGATERDKQKARAAWNIADGLALEWTERDGTRRKRDVRGFGRMLLTSILPSDLKGMGSLSFGPGSLTYRLTAPASNLAI